MTTKISIDKNLYKNIYKKSDPNFKISKERKIELFNIYEKDIKETVEKYRRKENGS